MTSSRERAQLFGYLGVALLGCAALFSFAARDANSRSHPEPRLAVLPAQPMPEAPPAIDLLRNEAASGSALSVRQVATALMNRYDLTGDAEDLYEGVNWADRAWLQYGDSELVARVTTRYCGQRVVRWHWFCDLGE
ncbi:MAG: hypothetical protein JWP29_5404 [Rhodoferax sp.]|nr:hypothetical protein [Rhodoferax sp.]